MNDEFKIKIVAIAKDEAAYIPQWIFHHLHFGFDAVEVWVNNTTDNSVEMLKEIGSKLGDEAVSVVEADDVLAQCIANNGLFQPEVYNRAYRKELERGIYTHLMFLDMDELWTPLNFKDSIKDVLRRYPESDGISFLWMVDYPDPDRAAFVRPFLSSNRLQKDRHVKSLVKISPRTRGVRIHNHVSQGQIFHLGDGTQFEDDDDVLSVDWAYISDNQLKARLGVSEKYFVVHQIYRSQQEYLSSLLRGRQHARDENVFKVNRWGYIPFHVESYTENICIDDDLLKEYNQKFEAFIESGNLLNLLESARNFIVNRYQAALSMLESDASLFGRYRSQLRGLRVVDAIFEKTPLSGELERVTQVASGDCMELIGWAADIFKNQSLTYQCEFSDGAVVNVPSQKISRPDLQKVHPERGAHCGFRIEVPPDLVKNAFKADGKGFALTAITQDGKERCTWEVRAAPIHEERTSDAIGGSVRSAQLSDGVLHVLGNVFDRAHSSVEMYAEINDVLFKFLIEKRDPTSRDERMEGDFSAILPLAEIQKGWLTKIPNFILVIDGVRRQLVFNSSYSYPMDKIYESLDRAIPPTSIKSSMPRQEQSCLISLLKEDAVYLSYGAPDTLMMAMGAGVKDAVFVDSDLEILESLSYDFSLKMAGSGRRFYPVHAKIGKTKEFGYPVDNSEWTRYPLYALAAWNLCFEKGISPDVVLIDARFRVSCFLVSLSMANPGTFLLFDDYTDRPQYHVVEKLVKPMETHGRLAKFVVPEYFDTRLLTKLLLQNCNNSL